MIEPVVYSLNDLTSLTPEELEKVILPCAHCGWEGKLKKRGNSIAYWVVECTSCKSECKGTHA